MSHLLSWLPQTKFQPPRPRSDMVLRPRLLELLATSLHSHRLTLVAAPAGYGKTSLLTSWLYDQGFDGAPVAWLSLDPNDDEPRVFLTGLIAAIERVHSTSLTAVHAALAGHHSPELPLLPMMGLLINEALLAPGAPALLVLDDLHVLSNPSIFQALDYLLEHGPPSVHFAFLTREDPPLALARLRARQQLTELRPPQLRFTPDEAAALVGDQLNAALSEPEVRALTAHTEGWAAGLRLLAGSLVGRSSGERAAVIERLAMSDRHVFDLLAVEVLDRQPPALQRFLLETSLLAELTPSRCAMVTRLPDAGVLLAEVERRNLFLVALEGGAEPSYRYHALFAEFLRRRLALERPTDLPLQHRRAAASMPPEQAIAHYLAAGAWDEAATAIHAAGSLLHSWGMIERLRTWITTIPDAARAAHPWLDYYLGVCDWYQSRFATARPHLERALVRFRARGDQAGRGETLALLGTLAQTAGRFAQARALFAEALSCPLTLRSEAQIHMGLAWIGLGSTDDAQVVAALAAALHVAERSFDTSTRTIITVQLRELFCCVAGGRPMVERACQLAAYPMDAAERAVIDASVHSLRAALGLLEGRIAAAVQHTDAALAANTRLGRLPWLEDSLFFFATYTYHLGGRTADWANVGALLRAGLPRIPGWYASSALALGYTLLDRGEIAQARALEADVAANQPAAEWPFASYARLVFRGLLALHDRRYPAAEEALRAAQPLQQAHSLCRLVGDVNLLLAALYLRWQRPEQARRALQLALQGWRDTKLPGLQLLIGRRLLAPLLEFATDQALDPEWVRIMGGLLQREQASEAMPLPVTGGALTPREVEVLRLIAQGASNKAIAEALVVSMPTVKTHVARLLAKLAVESRTAAVARARELGLL